MNGTVEPEDLAWLDPGHPLGKRVRASLEADIELYHFVYAQFGDPARPGRSTAAAPSP